MRGLIKPSLLMIVSAVLAAPFAQAASAASSGATALPDISPQIHFESVADAEPYGDRLGPARRIAALVVAQDNPSPKLIVDVGSHAGEFLEAFMQRFPNSHGQWTEPVDESYANAKIRLSRFGKNIDYVIGCPARDISLGCVPKGVDVLITSWVSIHQDLTGIRKFYHEAAAMLPSGGWLINLDHVGFGATEWEKWLHAARGEATTAGLSSIKEGPSVHHPEFVTPTVEDQLAAFRAAGIDDVQVVWRRFNTVLLMGRKN